MCTDRGCDEAGAGGPPEAFKGIDVLRTLRSFDPCLPCGGHLWVGEGRVLETIRSPTPSFAAPTWGR